jgi:hypothetical protein
MTGRKGYFESHILERTFKEFAGNFDQATGVRPCLLVQTERSVSGGSASYGK